MADKASPLRPGRFCDAHDGPVIVFLIGMRINRFHRPDKWLPVANAMPRMLKELAKQPDLGLLGYEAMLAPFRTLVTLQYWRDFDALHAYAHASEAEHFPAWRTFNRASKGNDAVGIFHETMSCSRARMKASMSTCPRSGWARHRGCARRRASATARGSGSPSETGEFKRRVSG